MIFETKRLRCKYHLTKRMERFTARSAEDHFFSSGRSAEEAEPLDGKLLRRDQRVADVASNVRVVLKQNNI